MDNKELNIQELNESGFLAKIIKKLNKIEVDLKYKKVEKFNLENQKEEKETKTKEYLDINNLTDNTKIILGLTIIKYSDDYISGSKLDYKKIEKRVINNSIDIFDNILYDFAIEILNKNKINREQFDKKSFMKYIKPFKEQYVKKLNDSIDSKPSKDILTNLIDYIINGKADKGGKFEESILSFVTVLFSKGVEFGAGYVMQKRLANNTWLVKKDNFVNIAVFVDLHVYFKNEDQSNEVRFQKKVYKMLDFLSETTKSKTKNMSVQYANRESFKSNRANILPYYDIGFYSSSDMIYEIYKYAPCLKSLDNLNTKDVLTGIYSMIKKFNLTGYCLNNIDPNNIYIEKDKFYILDVSKLTKLFKEPELSYSGYDSFSHLTKERNSTIYDDIESFLYLCEDILTNTSYDFDSSEENLEKSVKKDIKRKKKLDDYFLPNIVKTISSIRTLSDNDSVTNSESAETDSIESYCKDVYKKIDKIINKFLNKLSQSNKEKIYGTKLQEELYNRIYDSYEEENKHLSEIALKETFSILYGTEYAKKEYDEDEEED